MCSSAMSTPCTAICPTSHPTFQRQLSPLGGTHSRSPTNCRSTYRPIIGRRSDQSRTRLLLTSKDPRSDSPSKPRKKIKTHQRAAFFDLNLYPNVQQPGEATEQKTVCCWCCASGRIVCTMRTMKRGFVAGEVAPVWADIFNGSSKKIDQVSLALVKVETFHGSGSTRTGTNDISEVKRGGILPGGSQHWVNEGLIIPPLSTAPPTIDESACPNLQVTYLLRCKISPKGSSMDMYVDLPIVIGTVPLIQM